MKTLPKILVFTLLSVAFTTFYSCNKEEKLSKEELSDLIVNESEAAMNVFNDVTDNYNVASNGLLKNYCPPTCPTLTFSGNPQTCTYDAILDFGTEGCEGWRGWIRKGKIHVNVAGCTPVVLSITFDQFSVNDYLIKGTQTITYSQNDKDNPSVTIQIDGSVTDPEGKVNTIKSEMTKEWIEGFTTPYNYYDDVFSTTGNASGVCSEGTAYTMTITSPLIKAMDCKWIQEGEITIKYGTNTLIKNYGDGTCDSLATISENGVVKNIVLKP